MAQNQSLLTSNSERLSDKKKTHKWDEIILRLGVGTMISFLAYVQSWVNLRDLK